MVDWYGTLAACLLGYVVPIAATVLRDIFLDETVTTATLVTFAVVFVGVTLLNRESLRGTVEVTG